MPENKFSRIQIRRGTKANLKLINPMLREGEPISELDTGRMKIGDGVNRYNKLKYVGGGVGVGTPAITSFTITSAKTNTGDVYSSALVPNGCTITEVTLRYVITASPDSIRISSSDINYLSETYPEELTGTYVIDDISITEDKTFVLTLTTDDVAITSNVKLDFTTYCYYGTVSSATLPFLDASKNDSDMLTYTKKLISSRSFTTNTISCEANEYVYIILPTSIFPNNTPPAFTDVSNNFTGGFTLLGDNTTQIINKYGHSDTFYIFRSANHSLGNKSFRIS